MGTAGNPRPFKNSASRNAIWSREFDRHHFEGVASVPLLEAGAAIGLPNVCRSHRASLQGSALSFLLSLSVPVSALVAGEAARAGLRREIDNLNRRLADRKLLERAKGVLQTHFQWSEEQAYLGGTGSVPSRHNHDVVMRHARLTSQMQ